MHLQESCRGLFKKDCNMKKSVIALVASISLAACQQSEAPTDAEETGLDDIAVEEVSDVSEETEDDSTTDSVASPTISGSSSDGSATTSSSTTADSDVSTMQPVPPKKAPKLAPKDAAPNIGSKTPDKASGASKNREPAPAKAVQSKAEQTKVSPDRKSGADPRP